MHHYNVQLTLYAPESLTLPANVFDAWPESLIALEKITYLQDYHKQKPASRVPNRDRPRRHSRKQLANVSMPNIPPTPLCSLKHHTKRSLIGRPDYRFGVITMEAVDNRSYADATKGDSSSNTHDTHIQTCNLGYGILHFYRDAREESIVDRLAESAPPSGDHGDNDQGTILCTLAVPTYMSTSDFIDFVGPFDTAISHYRIIRDVARNKFSVLMKFRDSKAAASFQQKFNGKRFKTMEPEICHVVYINKTYTKAVAIPASSFPFLNKTLEDDRQRSESLAKDGEQELQFELPTCPVCLERMDESITGLMTIVCEHTLHCYCLSKWGDGCCPACRYSQRPVLDKEGDDTNMSESRRLSKLSLGLSRGPEHEEDLLECFECNTRENLWICMICGHIGCGRYQGAHAYDHYAETNHLFALEIETQRVWDYVGDGYVHRLIQNTVDGKLEELPSTLRNNEDTKKDQSKTKIEAMEEEYSALLTSQLDSQRLYYEEQLDDLIGQISTLTQRVGGLLSESKSTELANRHIRKQITRAEQEHVESVEEKESMDGLVQKREEEYQEAESKLRAEKERTESFLKRIGILTDERISNEKAIKDISDQVRDLEFFLEARDKVQNNPELEGGSVETHETSRSSHTRKGKKKGRR